MVNFTGDNAYSFNKTFDIPECFIDLENILIMHSESIQQDFEKRFIEYGLIGVAVCKRMADIDWLHSMIQDNEISLESINIRRNKAESLLSLYFGATKSLLDSISIGLNEVFDLKLNLKEQDFEKSFFRKQLAINPSVNQRYQSHQDVLKDVISWRHSAVHRMHPFVIPVWYYENESDVENVTDIEQIPREDSKICMVSHPDFNFNNLLLDPKFQTNDTEFRSLLVSPLYFPEKWRGSFLSLCTEICRDITEKIVSATNSSSKV
jgi:hypothetical protein